MSTGPSALRRRLPERAASRFDTAEPWGSSPGDWRSSTNIAAGARALAPVPTAQRRLEAGKDRDRDKRRPDRNTRRRQRSTTSLIGRRAGPAASAPAREVVFVEAVNISVPDFVPLARDAAAMIAFIRHRRTNHGRHRNQ